MGAGLAVIALIGGAVSIAIVGYHGILLAIVSASIGGSFTTLLVAFLSDALRPREPKRLGGEGPRPVSVSAEQPGPV